MPKQHKWFHILTELGSVAMVPLMYRAAENATDQFDKYFLFGLGTLMLYIDGYLLLKAGEWGQKDSDCDDSET